MHKDAIAKIVTLAAVASVAMLSGANTNAPWSNPLLHAMPSGTKAFISVDLSGSQRPLASVLKLVEGAGGTNLGQLAASGMAMLNLPKEVQDAFAKGTDKRAVAYYDPANGGGLPNAVVLVLGLIPGNSVAEALKPTATHEIDGVAYSDFKTAEAHVEGNSLILVENPKYLPAAVKPLRGGFHFATGRLADVESSIESTAEIVGWMDPNTVMSAAVPASASKSVSIATGRSFGFSLGLHKSGVSFAMGPIGANLPGTPIDLSVFKPLPPQFTYTLPGGPYFLTCLADPWPLLKKLGTSAHADKSFKSMLSGVENEIQGNYVVGLYPTRLKQGTPEGIDLLLELRPNEKARKGDALAKLKHLMAQFLQGDSKVFEPIKVSGADHAYRLNSILAGVMRTGLKTSMKSAGPVGDALIKDKNIVFAGVGGNVVVATSEPVLRKAVAALKFGKNALAYDPKFAELSTDPSKPTHFVLALSLTRALTLVSKTIVAMGDKGASSLIPSGLPIAFLGGLVSAWPDPLMLKLSMANEGLSGRLFVPVDFDTLTMFGQGGAKTNR